MLFVLSFCFLFCVFLYCFVHCFSICAVFFLFSYSTRLPTTVTGRKPNCSK